MEGVADSNEMKPADRMELCGAYVGVGGFVRDISDAVGVIPDGGIEKRREYSRTNEYGETTRTEVVERITRP